jgi:lantibiotic modifying enzyme
MISPDDRSFVVHAWIRNDDDTYGQYTYNSYLEAANDLRDEQIIAILAEDMVVDLELTYDQPSKPYNKTIWWRSDRDKVMVTEVEL